MSPPSSDTVVCRLLGSSGLRQARTVLAAVKTAAFGGGLRPVLTAAARGAVPYLRPGRRNGAPTEPRNHQWLWCVEAPSPLAHKLPCTPRVNFTSLTVGQVL